MSLVIRVGPNVEEVERSKKTKSISSVLIIIFCDLHIEYSIENNNRKKVTKNFSWILFKWMDGN